MSKYELLEVLPDGTERRKYENGYIRNQNGQLLERPFDAPPIISSEMASDYARRRKEKVLRAVEAGVMKVTEAPDPYAAVSRIVAKRAEVAMADGGRAGNDAARLVLEMLDAVPDKKKETVNTQRHVYEIDPETMKVVEEMVRMRRDGTA